MEEAFDAGITFMDNSLAIKQLHELLKRLKTDYLDLWQIHEVVYDNDPELHFAKDGTQRPVHSSEDASIRLSIRRVSDAA